MKFILITLSKIILFFYCITTFAQQPVNFGFEILSPTDPVPQYWQAMGTDFKVFPDSIHKVSGKYSVSVKYVSDEGKFGSIINQFPNKYNGKKITLEGYIKTKEIKDVTAGLFIRLNKGEKMVAVDTMAGREVKGTTDWQKYTTTIDLKEADYIYVAGFVKGQGQAWFDDFKVLIDDKPLLDFETISKESFKANTDHEFDESSKFSIENLSTQEIDNLYALGKAWGQLKYTNTKVAKGEYNWDYELFRALPMIQKKDFKNNLNQWVTHYGENQNSIPQNNYYLYFYPNIGNPIFQNEKEYKEMDFSDDGYRLLALFRYWNMIEYFFPYKHLIKKDWNEVLKQYIPEILEANNELSYQLTLMKLLAEVEDSHAGIYNPSKVVVNERGIQAPPLQIKFIENKAVITKIADSFPQLSNIKIGDEIIAVDGKNTQEFIKEIKKYISASNYATKLRNTTYQLLTTNKEEIKLTLSNEEGVYEMTVPTMFVLEMYDLFATEKPSHKELENNIGYIYPGTLKQGEITEIMTSFMNKKGIVVDLRCYPSDFIVFSMGNFLMPKPTTFVKFKNHNQRELQGFYMTEPLKVGDDFPDYYKGKIAILVNEETQSQAEYTAMAFQVAPKARVFGSQTAGADGNVSEIVLPGGFKTYMTGIGVYYPDGTETQQIGVKIDEPVKPTIQSVREGRDIVLEKALEYLK